MSTILDVEKKSGVSKSTISRYLNGKPVTPENRLKIECAIQALDYRLNPMASGLKSNKTNVVGIVLPDITDPFFPPIVKQLERKLREHGYRTLFNNYDNDCELEKQQVEVLMNQRVDGMIIATSAASGEHINQCIRRGIPTVMLDRLLDDVTCDSVTIDNYQATFDALSLAIRKGHRKIAIICGQENVYSDIVRFKAYRDCLTSHGIELQPQYMIRADLVEHDAKRQFMCLLNLEEPPTLIFCSNVYLAAGAMEARLEYQIDIPGEVSVLTFDRLSAFPYYNFLHSVQPEFSSICQPLDLIGAKAAQLLLRRIEEGDNAYPPVHIELKTSLFMTESIRQLNKK
ncbi:MAG: LacI family DNA-binding transcriptional regulator [Ruthenibacterium sp.]